MAHYPRVADEFKTIEDLEKVGSIARFGDGEFNIIKGGNCVSQVFVPGLRAELMNVLAAPQDKCLIGIPTMNERGPKKHWFKKKDEYARFLGKRPYHSAFISRPDSAPWVMTEAYWDSVEDLWRDQDVVLLGCGSRSLNEDIMKEARSIVHVTCNRRDAYAQIDALQEEAEACVLPGGTVFLCAGPCATALAYRLAMRGIHAMDLGHIGMFWRRMPDV